MGKLSWKVMDGMEAVPNCPHIGGLIVKGSPQDYPTAQNKFCPECGKPVGTQNLHAMIPKYITEHGSNFYAINEDGASADPCKWYTHESINFPNVLFTLNGEGEEPGDIWAKYFVNGKVQTAKAQLVFEEFNPSKLV
jgi:hypothetical protein